MEPYGLQAVLFDWDGTLVNSAETSYRCYVRVFEHFGIAFGPEDFGRTYSPDWYRTYEAMGLPRDRWDEADGVWLEAYARSESRLLPGAREALDRVGRAGLARGLVTSGDGRRVRRELRTLGLLEMFQAVVCKEDATRRKPDPEALLLALARLGTPATAAAYVGDSPEDVEMARAAGAYAVGVPGGFPNRAALEAARPDLLAEDLAGALDGLRLAERS